MNRTYKTVFNRTLRLWQAVTEPARGRSRWGAKASGLLTSVLLSSSVQAQSSGLLDPGTLGGTESVAWRVNAAGDVVVGLSTTTGNAARAFRWTQATGMVDLGTLGGNNSRGYGVNATGDVVVGYSETIPGNDINTHAFRWTQASGMMDLGTLGGSAMSVATAVNSPGDVVVGYSGADYSSSHAFRWTQVDGMTDLGTLGGSSSYGRGVNATGDVVVGQSTTTGNAATRAFRWTQASGMVDLGTLGGTNSSAYSVNAAGDVVVGEARISGNTATRAFRWTQASGMVDLGTLGGTHSSAYAVNTAGDVVVGNSTTTGNAATRAFRWTQATGMQSVENWLAANGVAVGAVQTFDALSVSAAGDVVVGRLQGSRAFIARVVPSGSPGSGGGSGLIDVAEFNTGLARVANSGLLASNDAELAMSGMHGNPMRSLLPTSRSTLWVGGDVGRQEHGVYDSDLGIAEVGYGHRFNAALQLNVSVGRIHSKADTGLGGDTTARSSFVLPELIVSLPSSVYATLSTYYGKGTAEIDRAYLNAGTLEKSFADPGLTSIGARARFDWLNAVSWGNTQLTPYASLTYLETKLDGYKEQSVAFNVNWNSRTEHATTARMGVDAVHPLSDSTTLLGRIEAAHRFENSASTTSGQVVGLYGFNFAGQDIQQNWLRLGAGMEQRIGSGIASVMLNATTQGEDPSYWINANYRWVF